MAEQRANYVKLRCIQHSYRAGRVKRAFKQH